MNYITLEDWYNFYQAVADHIEKYTIPQYGNYPYDPVTEMSEEVIKANIERYRNRVGKNQRGLQDSILDCYKIVHYMQILKAKKEGWEGHRLENWLTFSTEIQNLLKTDKGLNSYITADDFGLILDTLSRWLELTKKQETRAFKPYDVVKHKKGNYYIVIGYGMHSETKEYFVVYKSLSNNQGNKGDFYIRPKVMFEDGRFTLVKEGEMKDV